MQVPAINNNQYKNPFTSKVIVTPNTSYTLTKFMEDNPPVAKSILKGLIAIEKNGNKDVVVLERTHSKTDTIVLWVYKKIKGKFYRSALSQPLDMDLYTLTSNIEECYSKAEKNMIPLSSLEQKCFERFHPLK